MLKILLFFIVLCLGIILGPLIADHQGYVLIQTNNYNIETSITGLVIIFILMFIILFIIKWVIRRLYRISLYVYHWFYSYKNHRIHRHTQVDSINGTS